MSQYASNQEVVRFFVTHGIEVTQVMRDGPVRRLNAGGKALTLPMDASPEECLRRVREGMAAGEMKGKVD
jgi:hypothetical protein